jgi:hypothetical protein
MSQTIKEIQTNMTYRWFLGFRIHAEVTHLFTFGKHVQKNWTWQAS